MQSKKNKLDGCVTLVNNNIVVKYYRFRQNNDFIKYFKKIIVETIYYNDAIIYLTLFNECHTDIYTIKQGKLIKKERINIL